MNLFLTFFICQEMTTQVMTINKFVEESKKIFPGAKKLSIAINASYINKSKIDTYFTTPLAFVIENRFFTSEAYFKKIGAEFLMSIKDMQRKQMNANNNIYWMLIIDASEQKKHGEFAYYPTKLQVITDQKLIARFAPIEEFKADDLIFDDSDNEIYNE